MAWRSSSCSPGSTNRVPSFLGEPVPSQAWTHPPPRFSHSVADAKQPTAIPLSLADCPRIIVDHPAVQARWSEIGVTHARNQVRLDHGVVSRRAAVHPPLRLLPRPIGRAPNAPLSACLDTNILDLGRTGGGSAPDPHPASISNRVARRRYGRPAHSHPHLHQA